MQQEYVKRPLVLRGDIFLWEYFDDMNLNKNLRELPPELRELFAQHGLLQGEEILTEHNYKYRIERKEVTQKAPKVAANQLSLF